ncbi:MAG: IS3 family transposase [Thermodesulfovibrionales bacterium]
MLMVQIHNQFSLPISMLCKRFELPRASFYRHSRKDDSELSERIKTIAMKHPAWGYRLIMAELHKQGFKVNHKRVYRICCSENLQKPALRSNKKHSRISMAFEATSAEFPGHVWAGDFLHDRITSGKEFRIFNVMDTFSRRGFEPLVEFSLPGKAVACYFDNLCSLYDPPRIFRRDDGPEFRSEEFQRIIRKWRIKEEVIPPGQPFNNGHIESYNGTMREELLQREEFDNLKEAQERIKQWVRSYNTERPHSALGYRTPMEVWDEYRRN